MYDIYANAKGDAWRYALGNSGSQTLLTIGLNPSSATREKADVTVARVEQAATLNGYDGFIMLNLYPVRSTDFNELPSEGNQDAISKNLAVIEELVSNTSDPVVWTAWGESIKARRYFIDSAYRLLTNSRRNPVRWVHYGPLTQSGHPRHPSRLQYAWKFSELDTDQYIKLLEAELAA